MKPEDFGGSIWGTRPNVLKMYPSHSSDTYYEIRAGKDGKLYCTCPAWKYKRWCKHLEDYLKEDINGKSNPTDSE